MTRLKAEVEQLMKQPAPPLLAPPPLAPPLFAPPPLAPPPLPGGLAPLAPPPPPPLPGSETAPTTAALIAPSASMPPPSVSFHTPTVRPSVAIRGNHPVRSATCHLDRSERAQILRGQAMRPRDDVLAAAHHGALADETRCLGRDNEPLRSSVDRLVIALRSAPSASPTSWPPADIVDA